ncbi:hypothetical protein CHLRE_06g281286v5 [Chlamydomonas reinhardtii]|uniref:Uncharacterized protein n=1 Tax=Chlamydomonas reinhardtii TaxID=3055 RepID=A0A2K3DPM6_CHLRE|nr:uncharacterized protein CHLRE_06g281286v5 [Chlamydomonas reinhardtii]PNW82496.1 hypothetical protein CHLRE_06g281286v5 [Chlamydomonas reinhardtii]
MRGMGQDCWCADWGRLICTATSTAWRSAQLWEDGGGGAVDIRVFDTSDPDTTLLEAQLKVRAGAGANNKTLFSRRYKGMDRITTTEHVDIRKGVEVSDTLCYGGAESLPLSVKELWAMCKHTKAHFKRVKAAVRKRARQEGW